MSNYGGSFSRSPLARKTFELGKDVLSAVKSRIFDEICILRIRVIPLHPLIPNARISPLHPRKETGHIKFKGDLIKAV